MHPGDHTDTILTRGCGHQGGANLFVGLHNRLPNQLHAGTQAFGQLIDHELGLFGNLAQRLLAVEVLTSGNKPNFEVLA